MTEDIEVVISRFETEYVPLDTVLVRVILSDYDLTQPHELAKAREALDSLKADALSQDASGFDPSGTSGVSALAGADINASDDGAELLSETTDVTNASHGISQLSLETSSSNEADYAIGHDLHQIDSKTAEEKERRLADLFPNEKQSHIAYVLRKTSNNFTQAMDILLNYTFFNHEAIDGEDKVHVKGIDGFLEGNGTNPAKRKKGKNRKFRSVADLPEEIEPSTPQGNKWRAATADIDFVALHSNIAYAVVNSVYHKHSASLSKTVAALLDAELDKTNTSSAKLAQEPGVLALAEEFPTIPIRYAAALLRITTPSTSDALQLAKALTAPTSVGGGTLTPLKIVPQYAPVIVNDSPSRPTSRPMTPTSSTITIGGGAAQFRADRNDAFSKASNYHRKGKSDHLMGAAAAYYSQQGRDYDTAMRASSAAEADALVALQSSGTTIDLHGVTVKDATRIANEKVTQWWHNLGEGRVNHGANNTIGAGFRIIVGVGRHTEGGVGKLGPAVARMLVKEGWKVEVGSGALTVKGVARKR